MSNRESKLKLYSLGIVVVTKARGSDFISVNPIEELPLGNGLISDIKNKHKVSVPDSKGIKRAAQTESSNVIKAKWIPYGHSNRMSAPDVVQNETVVLLRFADTDEYYWTTIFREPGLRRLETVLYAFGNLIKGLNPFDKDSSYWAEVSTHDKHIHIHTAKSNGEPYEYDVKIDTDEGTVIIKDDIGNHIKLSSKGNQIELLNAAGSKYDMHQGILDITTPDSINIKTNNFNINASSISVSSSSSTSVSAGSSFTASGGSSVSISSPATSIS